MWSKSKDSVLYFGVLFALFIRWCISLFPYSGAEKPPMFGDYEAQRHWMEITLNLPSNEWYHNTSNNDLMYWGLDYPPLTAYHSWICGWIAREIDPTWVELNTSRGYESPQHKLFMRTTVAVVDIAIYIPALAVFWNTISKPFKTRDKAITTVLSLIYPGLVLIDYGHFQYNCVCLGLVLWAVVFLYWEWDLLAAAAFAASLHYKQMALYIALPFFAYLFGRCLQANSLKKGLFKFFLLSLTVLSTSAVCWLPFLWDSNNALQVLQRLFPFNRGLYEDKVANLWCALSVFIKLRKIFNQKTLVAISTMSTLIAALPSTLYLIRRPTFPSFRYALVNSSLAFFLFSYQVHEKSILFAAILLPLLLKDGLVIPYFAISIIFLVVALRAYPSMQLKANQKSLKENGLMYVSLVFCLCLSILPLVVRPPTHLPDLFILANATCSCIHFLGFFFYCHLQQHRAGKTTFLRTKKKA